MKQGHTNDRNAVAAFAREQRANFPLLTNGMTRRRWYLWIRIESHNRLAKLTAKRKKNSVHSVSDYVVRTVHHEARTA